VINIESAVKHAQDIDIAVGFDEISNPVMPI
jgi:hypothetical protein